MTPFTLTKSHNRASVLFFFSPPLLWLYQRGPCVCVWWEWRSWVSGKQRGGLVLRVCGWVCICIQALVLRGSRVRLSDQHRDAVCSFVRSLIFAYRRFTSCSLGKVGGWVDGGASLSLFFLPPTLTPSLQTFPATPRSKHPSILPLSYYRLLCWRHNTVVIQWVSPSLSLSDTQTNTHSHTWSRSAPAARSTQHHLWMFYPHWRLPWRCGLIGPRGGGGEEEEER